MLAANLHECVLLQPHQHASEAFLPLSMALPFLRLCKKLMQKHSALQRLYIVIRLCLSQVKPRMQHLGR